MNDFSKFDDTFKNVSKSKPQTPKSRKPKSHTSSNGKSNGRKHQDKIISDELILEIRNNFKRKISNESTSSEVPEIPRKRQFSSRDSPIIPLTTSTQYENKSGLGLESQDKKEILPHLSCNFEDFKNASRMLFEDDEQSQIVEKLHKEIYSPDIEDFSEGDEIFNMSQEGQLLISINNDIVDVYQQKPKYRPMNKIPKPGGLLEKLRNLKSKRLARASEFAKTNEGSHKKRKIEIIEHCIFRRRILIKFNFVDFLESPQDESEIHRFMAVPLEFKKFITKHSFYVVVFDIKEIEFLENNFMYFCKLFRAEKMYGNVS
ncbi:CLUMA_CG008363, isoform A [Clunio marinus]|uniref:CLUMA_CG008363, isoform A n=1 Tax=Clunio marinus TaxID=568069 RepID=A0A1J1I3F7_9DIPT|nr:CLUMA_CG008363, isoform A [Clunio marinus]